MNELTTTRASSPVTFQWDERREQAAALIARGDMTMQQIAEAVGVDRNTLHWWRLAAPFNQRIEDHLAAARQTLLSVGVAAKANRVRAIHDRWLRLQQVIEERAAAAMADPETRDVPGASSGLLTRQQKVVGSGRNAILIEEWVFDAPLMREIRSLEEHAARELGQWQPDTAVQCAIKLYAGIDLDRV
jgi:transposase-like protein